MAATSNSQTCVNNRFSSKHPSSNYFNSIIKIRGAALFSILQDNIKNDKPDYLTPAGAIITSISAAISAIYIDDLCTALKIIIVVISFVTIILSSIKLNSCFHDGKDTKNITADSVFADIVELQERK